MVSYKERIEILSRYAPITPQELDNLKSELEKATNELVSYKEMIKFFEEETDDSTQGPLEIYLRKIAESRTIALRGIRDALLLDFPDLKVEISAESDALHFQGEGLFDSNSRNLKPSKREIVERVSQILDDILPCYSLGPKSSFNPLCNPGFAVIEAVQIEGHTDSDGTHDYNIGLSSDRAVSTFLAMSNHIPELLDHKNLDGEPVLSVAGYGETRPVVSNETTEGRSTNRRIDLRLIMYNPRRNDEIDYIHRRLRAGNLLEPNQ